MERTSLNEKRAKEKRMLTVLKTQRVIELRRAIGFSVEQLHERGLQTCFSWRREDRDVVIDGLDCVMGG